MGVHRLLLALMLAAAPTQDAIRVVVSNPAAPANQPMPPGTGRIAGQILEADTNRPVPGSTVTITLTGGASLRVLANDQGRFEFVDLPKGQFSIAATLAGYAPGAYGRLRPSGPSQPLELGESERVMSVPVLMWPLAVIGGTLVDPSGEPVVGARVRAFRRTVVAGQARFVPAGTDATDDRGMFRIASLEPGAYVVGVPMTSYAWPASLEHYMLLGGEWPSTLPPALTGGQSPIGAGLQLAPRGSVVAHTSDRLPPADISADGRLTMYSAQFFSGASTMEDATIITLGAGEQRVGLSLALQSTRSHLISGTLTGAAGPLADLALTLRVAGAEGSQDTAVAVTDGRGRFTFVGVPPGQYLLRALIAPRGEPVPRPATAARVDPPPVWWSEQPVSVDSSDVQGVAVTLRRGARLRGTLQFKGALPAPGSALIRRIAVALEPADGHPAASPGTGRGRAEADGSFVTAGVPGGAYVLRVSDLPDGWFLDTAMHGARDISVDAVDVSDADIAGVTVVLTDRPAGLAGSVTAAPGGPAVTAALVVAFPVDPGAWTNRGADPRRLRSARPDRAGSYLIRALPAGEYFVAAIDDALAGEWQTPAQLAALARSATRVDVRPAETRQQNLVTMRFNVR
jgi:hypothetical protein